MLVPETVTGRLGIKASNMRGFSARYMKRIFYFLSCALLTGFILPTPGASAQEFNCTVSTNFRNLTGNDFTFLDELGLNVREYINLRRWTDDAYEQNERIDCTMQIIFTEAITLTRFRVRLIVASRRPIYGTVQQSTVTQFNDDSWVFDYARGTPLIFEPDRFHPITSVLNYYAYVMLGYDYDTFSEFGGTIYFEQARRVAEIAQSTGSIGWAQMAGDRSRGELISQILDPRFREVRKAYWDYHYACLDRFVKDPDAARRIMLDVVNNLEVVASDVTRAYYLDQFFTSKYKEITSIFEGSSIASRAYDTLSRIDPAHLSDYSRMLQ